MKLILLEKVEKLGNVGDVVTVKDGFGRNFLLPRKKAMVFTSNSYQFIERKKKAEEEKYKKEVEKNEVLAEKIGSLSCTIKVQAGEDEKLYGSVTSQDVQEALDPEGIKVDKRQIEIEKPIKKLGVHSVKIKLLPEVEASLKIWVVKS